MATADAESAAYEKDRESYVTDAYNSANRPTGARKEQLQQDAAAKMKEARVNAKLNQTMKEKWMKDQLINGPKEEVYVEPKIVTGIANGAPTSVAEGYMIRINGVSVYLKPGMNKTHPIIVERYRQIKRGQAETTQRKALLQGDHNWKDVAEGMNRLNDEYNSRSGSGGEAGGDWASPDVYQEF